MKKWVKTQKKVLVIGEGCREHALMKALMEDPHQLEVYALPKRFGIPGIKNLPNNLLNNQIALVERLLKEKIKLIVIGPEKPLAKGLSDFLRAKGFYVFGPSQKASQLEASKIFAKKFMTQQKIPTASYQVVSSVRQTLKEAKCFSPPYVLKADGLAGGKGVFLCSNINDLKEKAHFLFNKKALGVAGKRAVLEQFQKGKEVSIFVLTDGQRFRVLPPARDYKKLYEGGLGPNTGGMGAIAPVLFSNRLLNKVKTQIIKPTLKGLRKKKLLYRGVLYLGLMVDSKQNLKLLEYNIRFGDPEAQVILPLLDGSWYNVFYQIAVGRVPTLKWKKKHCACVVLTAPGYPEKPIKGLIVEGKWQKSYKQNQYFLQGGIALIGSRFVTNGGRVLNSVALSTSCKKALEKAYQQVKKVFWKDIYYRKDIGS